MGDKFKYENAIAMSKSIHIRNFIYSCRIYIKFILSCLLDRNYSCCDYILLRTGWNFLNAIKYYNNILNR